MKPLQTTSEMFNYLYTDLTLLSAPSKTVLNCPLYPTTIKHAPNKNRKTQPFFPTEDFRRLQKQLSIFLFSLSNDR